MLVLLLFVHQIVAAETTRFDYRQTFKPPFYSGLDSLVYYTPTSTSKITVSKTYVRLTNSIPSQHSHLVCRYPNPYLEWQLEFSFSVFGRGSKGGDGLAIWFTKSRNGSIAKDSNLWADQLAEKASVALYGNEHKFTSGFGITLDSSDSKSGRTNPLVSLIVPDQENVYKSLATCYRDYRNTVAPVFALLRYTNNTLSLAVDLRRHGKKYTNCFSVPFKLPVDATGVDEYRLSVSASTTEMENESDDHDMNIFEVSQINPDPVEHQLRPFEQVDVAEGKEFKMDSAVEKKIHDAERIVRDEPAQDLANSENDSNTPEKPDNSLETEKFEIYQQKIIDSLRNIETKLNMPIDEALKQSSDNTNKQGDDFKVIQSEIASLRQALQEVKTTISQLKVASDLFMREIHDQIKQSKVTGEETNLMAKGFSLRADMYEEARPRSSDGIPIWGWVMAGFVVVGAVYAYTYLRGYRSEKEKKYF